MPYASGFDRMHRAPLAAAQPALAQSTVIEPRVPFYPFPKPPLPEPRRSNLWPMARTLAMERHLLRLTVAGGGFAFGFGDGELK